MPDTDTTAEPIRYFIRTWILGATLSHLSFGMSAIGMKGAVTCRVASVGFREAPRRGSLPPSVPRACKPAARGARSARNR
eukprot:5139277-Prymnesium_polylepis.1